MAQNYDWDHGFTIDFDLDTGRSTQSEPTKRYLSQMAPMFADQEAVAKILEHDDPLIYEFHELGFPEREGDIAFGMTILYPGKVGDEYYMTKGHFHTKVATAEIYHTIHGHGFMVMENPEGDTTEQPLEEGSTLYVARRYAHRSVNVGDEPLIMYFAFPADAGHDYGTIETKGYHKLCVERDGEPAFVDNPNWK